MLASFADLEGSYRAAPGNGARHPKAGGFLVRRAPWRAVYDEERLDALLQVH
jgi:hypothetical protein